MFFDCARLAYKSQGLVYIGAHMQASTHSATAAASQIYSSLQSRAETGVESSLDHWTEVDEIVAIVRPLPL